MSLQCERAVSVLLRSRQCGVDRLVPAGCVGAVRRSHGQTVEDWAAIGPPGWMEVGILIKARGIARVRVVIVGALKVSIVTLGAGERGSGRGSWCGWCDTSLATVRAVIRVWGRAVRVLVVVAGAQLLCFNMETVLAHLTGGGRGGGHGALSAPRWPVAACMAVWGSVSAARQWSLAVAVAVVWGAWGVAIEREVLVKLVNVKGLHIADDISAELRDVYIAEVNVLPAAVNKSTAFMFQILLHPMVEVCFRSSGWCRWTMGLPWKKRCKSEMKVCHFKHKIISRIKQISRKVHTCMVRMVVSVTHSSQSSHPWFSFVHVMSQFCSRIWVALAWFHILPSSRLVLVVWMIFLVLNSKPLCFIYEWPLFTLWKQAKIEK